MIHKSKVGGPREARPISTYLDELRWFVLRADGSSRPAADMEIARLPVSGRATTMLARALTDRAALLDACRNALMDWERNGDISDDDLERTAVQIRAAIKQAEAR